MKIVNAGYTMVDIPDVLKKIEYAGRICYKSEDKITEDSAKTFCTNIIKRGHEAVLEHASFCFKTNFRTFSDLVRRNRILSHAGFNSFLHMTYCDHYLVSGNVRAWRDFFKAHMNYYQQLPAYFYDFIFKNPILFPEFQDEEIFDTMDGDLLLINTKTLTDATEIAIHHYETVHFVCDRGVSHEIVRHRPASYCQESTRYCNYSKNKFGNEITVIKPCFWAEDSEQYMVWKDSMQATETAYFKLLDLNATPQEARSVLPTELKTEIVMTANMGEWRHFLNLRTSDAAHPQIREVAQPLLRTLKLNYPLFFNTEVTK